MSMASTASGKNDLMGIAKEDGAAPEIENDSKEVLLRMFEHLIAKEKSSGQEQVRKRDAKRGVRRAEAIMKAAMRGSDEGIT